MPGAAEKGTKMQNTNQKTGRPIAMVIVGMHRSGTSALAGTLALAGCAAPSNQIAKGAQNLKGFFEAEPIARLNDDLLARAGLAWDEWTPMRPESIAGAGAQSFRDRAEDKLRQEFGNAELLVLKDPRVCRLLPFWLQVLEDRETTPLLLLTHRHPQEVQQSLQIRNKLPPTQGLLLWLAHVLEAEAASRGRTRTFTSFERLLANPMRELTRIESALGAQFPKALEEAATEEIEAFLDADMRHHAVSGDEILSPLFATVYGIFERWAERGEKAADYPVLDRARSLLEWVGSAATMSDGEAANFCLYALNFLWNSRELLDERHMSPEPNGDAQSNAWQIALLLSMFARRKRLNWNDDASTAHADKIAALQSDIVNRDRELGQMARLLTQAESKADMLDRKLSESREDARRLSGALSQVTGELQALRKETTEELQALRNETAGQIQQIGGLMQENSELHALVAHVEDQRRALAASSSWRITGPLRRVARLLRRRRSN